MALTFYIRKHIKVQRHKRIVKTAALPAHAPLRIMAAQNDVKTPRPPQA
jgi:hypothetical protein